MAKRRVKQVRCKVCKTKFYPNRCTTVCCSGQCSKVRQQQRLKELGEARKVTRIAERKVIACVICEVGFTPYGRQIYCGKRCAEQGLALAVERQRQRRLQIRNATGLTEDKHEG